MEEVRTNPKEDYLEYLRRETRNSRRTMWQTHQLKQSRLVAEYYGLTPEEIEGLDEELKQL